MPNEYGWTALMEAASGGYENIVMALLRHDPSNLEHQNEDGQTALMVAAEYGYVDTVHALLRFHAHVDMVDEEGHTALMYAAMEGHPEVVKMLLDHCADPDLRCEHDGVSQTALDYAIENNHPEVIKVFEMYDADTSRGVCYWHDMMFTRGESWCEGEDEFVCTRDCHVVDHPHPQLNCGHREETPEPHHDDDDREGSHP